MNRETFVNTAKTYLERGFSIAPIKYKEKLPAIKWEKYQNQHATPSEVTEWAEMYEKFNIAIITGQISGITIVDIDGEEGFQSAAELNLPETLSVTTGKGRHLYYKYCDDPSVSNKVRMLPGIDIRNNGGYVVAPPSVHARGTNYEFDDVTVAIADFPQAVIDLCIKNSIKKGESQDKVDITAVREGSRNSTLTSMAGSLHHMGLDFDLVLHNIQELNSRFTEPLPEKEVETLVRSVFRYDTNAPIRPLTDFGVVERFFDRYHDSICYNSDSGRWHIYNGVVWEAQPNDQNVLDKLISVIRNLPNEFEDEKIREAADGFARKCEGASRFRAIFNLCKDKLSRANSTFDANPWIFNCSNVTFDLKEGVYREHNPKDMLSKHSRVYYNPDAKCPTWETFLNRIFSGDKSLINYLQRAMGYCLTGDVSEQVFFTIYGSGANGKSVFVDMMRYNIGDYGQQTEFSTFLAKNGDGGIRNDIASLVGCRFVTASESSMLKTIDDALIKQITGGDKVRARFLHKEYFEFQPHMKIFLTTNHKPNIRDDSIGMWRRVRLIPFTVTIPPEERDKQLTSKLKNEASGILNWCLEGLKRWKKEGLGHSAAVEQATTDYQESMDIFGRFLTECTIKSKTADCKSSALYNAYVEWCKANGERSWTQTSFSIKMIDKHFRKEKRRDGNYWIGVDLNKEF